MCSNQDKYSKESNMDHDLEIKRIEINISRSNFNPPVPSQ